MQPSLVTHLLEALSELREVLHLGGQHLKLKYDKQASREDCINLRNQSKGFLQKYLKLASSLEKMKITHAEKVFYFNFSGIQFIKQKLTKCPCTCGEGGVEGGVTACVLDLRAEFRGADGTRHKRVASDSKKK